MFKRMQNHFVADANLLRLVLIGLILIADICYLIWFYIEKGKLNPGMTLLLLLLVIVLIIDLKTGHEEKSQSDLRQELLVITDPTECIAKANEMLAEGKFQNHPDLYYNTLSLCYNKLGEYKTALEMNIKEQRAITNLFKGKELTSGDPLLASQANEVSFLISLEEYAQAAKKLDLLEDKLRKLAQDARYATYVKDFQNAIIYPHRAKLAIINCKPELARKYLDRIQPTTHTRDDDPYQIQLLYAECEVQEGNLASARERIADVLENAQTESILARAEALNRTF